MSVTIKDIARLANVSTATVSNVLTRKKYVSKDLEQRVHAAVRQLDYRPNIYARSLKTNRSYTIGVQVPDITNPFFSNSVKNIQSVSNANGYQIMLYDSDCDIKREERNISGMLDAHVDGIISIAPRMDILHLINMVETPLIIMDHPAVKTNQNVGFIYADNYQGGASVADYLIAKNYKRFICLAGPVDVVSNAKARLMGFIETLELHNISRDQCDIYYGDFTFESGYTLMKKALEHYTVLPKTIAAFVTSDIMAWGAMEALKEKKMKMPQNMGIIGYDNIYFSNFLYPTLTTVDNPSREMALKAISLMLEALEDGYTLSGVSTVLRSSLIVRKSC